MTPSVEYLVIYTVCMANTLIKLEKMATNDVLPLKAARRDVIANWKFLGPRDTCDSSIYIRYAAPPYSTSFVVTASVYGRWVETSALFLASGIALSRWEMSQNKHFIAPQFFSGRWTRQIFDMHLQILFTSQQFGRVLQFLTHLLECLFRVLIRRYSPLSLKDVENDHIFGRPQLLYCRLLARFTVHLLYKIWLSSVCWPPSANHGNEIECIIYGGWVKTQVQ